MRRALLGKCDFLRLLVGRSRASEVRARTQHLHIDTCYVKRCAFHGTRRCCIRSLIVFGLRGNWRKQRRPISVSSVSTVQLCREIGRARARQTVPLSGPRRVPGEAIGCKGPRSFRHCRNPRLYPALRPRPGSSRNRGIALSHFSQSVQSVQSVSQFSSVQFSYVVKLGGPGRGRRCL